METFVGHQQQSDAQKRDGLRSSTERRRVVASVIVVVDDDDAAAGAIAIIHDGGSVGMKSRSRRAVRPTSRTQSPSMTESMALHGRFMTRPQASGHGPSKAPGGLARTYFKYVFESPKFLRSTRLDKGKYERDEF